MEIPCNTRTEGCTIETKAKDASIQLEKIKGDITQADVSSMNVETTGGYGVFLKKDYQKGGSNFLDTVTDNNSEMLHITVEDINQNIPTFNNLKGGFKNSNTFIPLPKPESVLNNINGLKGGARKSNTFIPLPQPGNI